jgi:hypothetical protein
MSNGATVRVCELREIGHTGREMLRIYGTQGSFENDVWCDKHGGTPVRREEMRDPLPPEVVEAFKAVEGGTSFYGDEDGTPAYLVHEFVDAVATNRRPATNAWEGARYMAPGIMAHKSAMSGGEVLGVPDWGDPPD